ncbi:ankyrin repeat-containing domain protein [Lasiosphaeria miniovina]|uniref:Ankyrin repeat-containing domain protein n=1 Tax=Lasiosphaeria miniovina TaxID=1954250 RepID=A0AA40AMR2_9PEZI|nr:ankyrin repeat-containing domain protein [Lasiosphaeria miniovina]KAK0718620.1 ankyrin repeat-containing domain protein [Lasiosphaeria miniovina]
MIKLGLWDAESGNVRALDRRRISESRIFNVGTGHVMDPLSICASVAALIGITESAGAGLGRLWELRQAPTHLQALQNEVTDFRAILTFVRDALEDLRDARPSADLAVINSAVNRGASVVRELQDLIETRLTRPEPSNGIPNVRHRGFLRQQRIQRMCESLRDARTHLGTALTAANYLQLRHSMPRFHLAVQSITLVDGPQAQETSTADGRPVEQQFGHFESGAICQATEKITSHSQDILRRQKMAGFEFESEYKSSSATAVRIEATPANRRCEPFCACQCHIMLAGQTPRWLQAVFGALFYQFTGTPLLYRRPCNSPRCLPRGGSFRFEYLFPTSILPLILRVTGTWNHLGGLGGSWTLRIPDHVPITMQAVFNMIHQAASPQSVARYLDTNGISARAIDPGTTAQVVWTFLLGSPADRDNFSPLRQALEDSDSLNTMGFSLLHKIVTGLSTVDLELALQLHPELVNARDSGGETPLHWAFRATDVARTSLLLQHGADPNARGHRGRAALHTIGPSSAFVPCIDALAAAGADVNAIPGDVPTPETPSPLVVTIMYGNLDAALALLRAGADPNHPGAAPLVWAAWLRGLDFVRAIVGAGAELDRVDDGYTAVMLAVQGDNLPCVRFLVERGARLDIVSQQSGCSVVVLAVKYAGVPVIRALAEAKIRGLPVDEESVERYWQLFDEQRGLNVVGQRDEKEEREAVVELLASLRPEEGECGNGGVGDGEVEQITRAMPGAWPLESR